MDGACREDAILKHLINVVTMLLSVAQVRSRRGKPLF